ncbi:MAG: ATP-binding protein [Planctomycetes bacterium]|nr:ATP-binding protein [Planctomycetota bacterium]
MAKRAKKTERKAIVVAGDATIDWFLYPEQEDSEKNNGVRLRVHRMKPGSAVAALPGGVEFLAETIEQFCKLGGDNTTTVARSKTDPKEIKVNPPADVTHSSAALHWFRTDRDSKEKVLRVRESYGYSRPHQDTRDLKAPDNDPKCEETGFVVLDDACNGFREGSLGSLREDSNSGDQEEAKDDKTPEKKVVPEAWPESLNEIWKQQLEREKRATEDSQSRPVNPAIPRPIIVHKMSRPLATEALWEFFTKCNFTNHIVVVNAKDVRDSEGVQIGKALSWERTAKDFVYQIKRSPSLERLQTCPYLIVLFDTDGALLYRRGAKKRSWLVFDPNSLEGDFASSIEGTMNGLTSIFTAALVTHLKRGVRTTPQEDKQANGEEQPEDLSPQIIQGMKIGLARMRDFLKAGFAYTASNDGALQGETGSTAGIYSPYETFCPGPIREPDHDESKEAPAGESKKCKAADGKTGLTKHDLFQTCEIQEATELWHSDPLQWRILDENTRFTRHLAAEEIVVEGLRNSKHIKGVPTGKFGNLITVDRMEIESYSAIRELIREFLEDPRPERPLCFSVFGPPGSGKSFGVKQVVKSIGNEELESITFNISQFQRYQDLVAAFHRVRDIALKGNVPFVFFDEFDTNLGEQQLGWLRYFLAPMQDGEFKDESGVHPIGRSIFVFAGGTRSSYERFQKNAPDVEFRDSDFNTTDAEERFRRAKGPDFVSRLRGFINVMGPNRQRGPINDNAFIIRRAMLLRNILERHFKAEGLFEIRQKKKGKLEIDHGVLRALLYVSDYRHGIRSMQAIIDMCRLANKTHFDLASLPRENQLGIHVDPEEFMLLTQRECFQSLLSACPHSPSADEGRGIALVAGSPASQTGGSYPERENALIEAIAPCIHHEYARHNRVKETYEELSDHFRDSNRDAAADIPNKLRHPEVNCGLMPKTAGTGIVAFPAKALRTLARLEHERWCREKRLIGLRWGPERAEGTHPDLLSFEELLRRAGEHWQADAPSWGTGNPPEGQEKDDEIKAAVAIEKDYQAIRDMLGILQTLGFEVYEMLKVDPDEIT